MSTINYDLTRIRALIFDIDGVLSCNIVPLQPSGDPLRTVNVKDSYALQLAVRQGLSLAIITGARPEHIRQRYESFGISDVYIGCSVKIHSYHAFRDKYRFLDEEILYMGDDIPDIEILRNCGLPCCPKDAAPDVKNIVQYISHYNGGYGCVRDVIEQVLRAQDKWMVDDAFSW